LPPNLVSGWADRALLPDLHRTASTTAASESKCRYRQQLASLREAS
jgi:hypothetical protein